MFGSGHILFVDIDAYFAQVEQRARPELRGKPVGIVPAMVETTCCIAVSYEAKRRGVKTGCLVRDARRLCPDIILVESRPELYIHMHDLILAAADTCVPIGRVLSIDEFACPLAANEKTPGHALHLAQRVKAAVRARTGLTCSIGVAPNETLAKVASAMEKPNGLVLLRRDELPERLFGLELDNLPGIGRRMLHRLHEVDVRSVEALCALSESRLVEIWKSIEGQRWWRRLRGLDVPPVRTRTRSFGHQRILPPAYRTVDAAHAVLTHLIAKAAARARRSGCAVRRLSVGVRCLDHRCWAETVSMEPTQSTRAFIRAFNDVWPGRLPATPIRVDATLHDVLPILSIAAPLFPAERREMDLWRVMDRINTRYGKHAVYLGAMHAARGAVPVRIPFSSIPDLDLPA